jgi:hypothetical protein
MTDRRPWQPAGVETPHAIPKDMTVLTAPRQRAMPEPPYLEPKYVQRVLVQGHSVVPDMPTHHRLQPLAQFGDGFVHSSLKLGFHFVQFRLQSWRRERGWPKGTCLSKTRPGFRAGATRTVRWSCPTSQVRSSSAYVLRLPDASQGNCIPGRNLGSPGSLARSLRTCTGSLTARDSGTPRDIGVPDGAFRILLERRRPGGSFFRGRCGSLIHHFYRVTFAFTTPRRFNRRTGELG